MRVRKYQADSIQKAMGLVKKDLGGDALILSTKPVRAKPGGSGKVLSEKFEITAMPAQKTRDENFGAHKRGSKVFDGFSDSDRLKDLLFVLNCQNNDVSSFLSDPVAAHVYVALVRSGISSAFVREMLEKAGTAGTEGMDVFALFRQISKSILNRIYYANPFSQNQGQAVCAYVGPTGVGKTTTIAKLAADLSLSQKKTVGLLSIDNYRIGALEQLKTYASILGLPCFCAFNKKDLQFALDRLKDKDVVLIDTAGQSQYDTARMQEMKMFLSGERAIDVHLVLSAVTCELEMERAAEKFSELEFGSYVFTKIDETQKRGTIINQVLKRPLPVSFISTGQRVPEDIFAANKKSMHALLFGEIRKFFKQNRLDWQPDTWGFGYDTARK